MNHSLDYLYEQLPYVYRQRDADQGYPLHALLQVITAQVNVVEADIAQLYENLFIETCADWAVPYLGDLIGYRAVYEAGEMGALTPDNQQRAKILVPRREVANTIRYRQRKGSLALLELLANAVAGWPARAVEFARLLAWAQALHAPRLERGRWVDVRQGDALDRLGSPFDELAHTVDVRRPNSRHTPGRANLPAVGLFVWRLQACPVTQTTGCYLQEAGHNCYTFSALGNDVPLYTHPQAELEPTSIAGEMNAPAPIRRRALAERLGDYYGEGKSLQIWLAAGKEEAYTPIPPESIIVADLTDWRYRPQQQGQVAVDPVLGRIAFRARRPYHKRLWVSYHYGFSANMGGGEYSRPIPEPADPARYRVVYTPQAEGEFGSLAKAFAQWQKEAPPCAVIEIMQSGVYKIENQIELQPNQILQLQAANRTRPMIHFADTDVARPEYLWLHGAPGSRFILDGILVAGRGFLVEGPLDELTLRHVTLVPGWSLYPDSRPREPGESSLELIDVKGHVVIEHSIMGFIQVTQNEVNTDPINIHLSDTILDATDLAATAVGAPDWPLAHATLTFQRCTVLGKVQTHAIALAENSIFAGQVEVGRSQQGCIRFCYVAPGSRSPRRYSCQPDLAERRVEAQVQAGELDAAEQEREQASERLRVRPQFNSVYYGTPAYCQLAQSCAQEIRRGAEDGAEMGAFHDLFQPQREANLRARLEEYTPAGMDVGIIYAS